MRPSASRAAESRLVLRLRRGSHPRGEEVPHAERHRRVHAECLAIRVDRKLKSTDVIDVLSDLFILRGVPTHIRSDNGPEFVAKAVQDWIAAVGAKTAYIEPGSPWENGYIECFNARLRDETARWRDLLLSRRSQDHRRELAPLLQHPAPARVAGLQAAGAGGLHSGARRAGGCATPTGSADRAGPRPVMH